VLTRMIRHENGHDRKRKNEQDQSIVLSAGNDHEIRVADCKINSRIRPDHLMPQFRRERQTAITGLASASIALGEIVRRTLETGESLEDILTWNLQSRTRTSYEEDFSWQGFDPRDKKIGVVGVGAVGLMYLEAIHELGFEKVYLWDFDTWDITNFSRAPHCQGESGRLKSHSAARHFNKRDGQTRYSSKNQRFEETSRFPEVDLLISAVDGFDNQIRVINYSQRNQIPLLIGGCTPFSAMVYAYMPGKTSSLLYQYDFLKQAYLDSIRESHPHCNDPEAAGSQVITTSLCAAILAGETINALCGEPLKGQFRYDMLRNPKLEYLPLGNIQDLGTEIPFFVPLPRENVQRNIGSGSEEILINGIPFEKWYDKEGNFLYGR